MRNIPLFTTQNGVASLILSSVPEDGKAYVTVEDTCAQDLFLKECKDFCLAVGATRVFASGKIDPGTAPYATVLSLCTDRAEIPDTDACLLPVVAATKDRWLSVYREKMKDVPGAKYLKEPPKDAYFVHRGEKILGIGAASGEEISVLAACEKGQGATVLAALCHALGGETVRMEVSKENEKAMALYEKMGFLTVAVNEIWYEI